MDNPKRKEVKEKILELEAYNNKLKEKKQTYEKIINSQKKFIKKKPINVNSFYELKSDFESTYITENGDPQSGPDAYAYILFFRAQIKNIEKTYTKNLRIIKRARDFLAQNPESSDVWKE